MRYDPEEKKKEAPKKGAQTAEESWEESKKAAEDGDPFQINA